MLRNVRITVVLAALVLGGSAVAAAPASADTPGCVSRTEYGRVDNPVNDSARTQRMVQRLFDTSGVQIARGGGEKTVTYKACWTKKRRVYIGYYYGFGWVSKDRVGHAWFFEHKTLASATSGDGDGW